MFTLADLAKHINADLQGDAETRVDEVAELGRATERAVSVYLTARWKPHLELTQAGAVIISQDNAHHCPSHLQLLVCDDPRAAWSKVIRLFHPRPQSPSLDVGIHPTALVADNAIISQHAAIGPYAIIESGAQIEAGVIVGHHAYVGQNTRIGDKSIIMPHACILDDVQIGSEVWIGPHSTIGSTGFGLDEIGRLPHPGGVMIGDCVSIGAQTCVDRGTVDATRIGPYTHIDNQVQVGHNAQIGAYVIICGQTGIAGSAVIEDKVTLGGQVGVANQITIGQNARVAAKSGVTKNLAAGGEYSGYPAEPHVPRLRREARRRRAESE